MPGSAPRAHKSGQECTVSNQERPGTARSFMPTNKDNISLYFHILFFIELCVETQPFIVGMSRGTANISRSASYLPRSGNLHTSSGNPLIRSAINIPRSGNLLGRSAINIPRSAFS